MTPLGTGMFRLKWRVRRRDGEAGEWAKIGGMCDGFGICSSIIRAETWADCSLLTLSLISRHSLLF